MARYQHFLPKVDKRRVVILAHDGLGEELRGLLAEFADDSLYVLAATSSPEWGLEATNAVMMPAATLARLNWRLKTIGPVDVIVDLNRHSEGRDLWSTLFFHLRPRGVYILARSGADGQGGEPGASARAELFLRRHWGSATEAPDPAGQELVASCARFLVDRSFLLVEKRQRHFVKLSDAEVGRLLPQRNTKDTVTTLATLPAGELTCAGEVVNHESAVPIDNMSLLLAFPELRVQHYTGKLGLISNSLLIGDSTVLPASYRYPTIRVMNNPRLTEVNSDFGRLADDLRPRRVLNGDYYHLDCWYPGHFGHVMTEVVGRLWGWPLAKEQFPDLKAIFRRRYPNERHPALEVAVFTAFGIDPADIVWVDEPVWLRSVVTATPMWQNQGPYYVHPQLARTWERLRAGAVAERPESPSRIFVSRRPNRTNRSCRNATAVEDMFTHYGFAIVFPEELSLAEQANVFGNATVVAGFAGSGLFNICYAGRMTTLIVLSQEAYFARYEHLYTMLLGCTTHYFWSTPDVPQPPGRATRESYLSAWDFDFERNGDDLARLLGSMPAPTA